MANAAGWQPDAEREDQERYWDGSVWTDRVRRTGSAGPPDHAPDHSPQLHRAMSAAAADLDAVDEQISTLFDRTDGDRPARTPRPLPSPPPSQAVAPDDDDDLLELFAVDDMEMPHDEGSDGATVIVPDRRDVLSEYEELTNGAFDDLDAELAGEEPDQPGRTKRRMFGRRVKGTTTAPR